MGVSPAIPLNAEALIAAGLLGGVPNVDEQQYQVHDSKQGMHPFEVVGPDGKLILTTGSNEYAKDFAFAMNQCRWHRLNPDDGK